MSFRKAGKEKLLLAKYRQYQAKKKKKLLLLGKINTRLILKIKKDGKKGRYKIQLILENNLISLILRMSYVFPET